MNQLNDKPRINVDDNYVKLVISRLKNKTDTKPKRSYNKSNIAENICKSKANLKFTGVPRREREMERSTNTCGITLERDQCPVFEGEFVCRRDVYCRGVCKMHYKRELRKEKKKSKKCKIDTPMEEDKR